ncbi:hypothetical protein GR925_22415 [Streptomyces sp. HUCO-GS316]|uniref:hypothetical protein n=1 Tax=Streptomyces sp. HUCO-GS316 TaxID=2692198 RepID=UPI001372122B|nr:hypothetical protein [Streptomyces sp. HUCO-GS316]MXM66123.1 hypothetical protein [Streptomyces sp. HUCO-GS316]
MAAISTGAVLGVAAEAALAVPGVAGLHPRLAAAASPTQPRTKAKRTPPEVDVRIDRAPDGSEWHLDVRCVLTPDHKALDTARNVHDQVRAAVLSHLAAHDAPQAFTVTITVTRIAARNHTGSVPGT